MFPNSMALPRKHRGFLIPVAAMIVVGIGVLALAMSRIASQSSQASVIEGISAQAFYAAESGAQYGMSVLMFNVTNRATADTNCGTVNGSTLNYTVTGLQACSAQITCTVSTVVGNPQSFYTIRSEASCGSGDIQAERIVQVSSYM